MKVKEGMPALQRDPKVKQKQTEHDSDKNWQRYARNPEIYPFWAELPGGTLNVNPSFWGLIYGRSTVPRLRLTLILDKGLDSGLRLRPESALSNQIRASLIQNH